MPPCNLLRVLDVSWERYLALESGVDIGEEQMILMRLQKEGGKIGGLVEDFQPGLELLLKTRV
jgi:hypothetical protein